METLDFLPLVSIPMIYFITAFLKPHLRLPLNLCAMCVAVFLTWVIMLALFFGGGAVSLESIAILMGMSIAGLMYKMEIFYKEHKVRNFWGVRIFVIVGGFYFVLALINREWNIMFFTVFVTFFGSLVPTLFFQRISHEDVVKDSKFANKSLLEKLEDCC